MSTNHCPVWYHFPVFLLTPPFHMMCNLQGLPFKLEPKLIWVSSPRSCLGGLQNGYECCITAPKDVKNKSHDKDACGSSSPFTVHSVKKVIRSSISDLPTCSFFNSNGCASVKWCYFDLELTSLLPVSFPSVHQWQVFSFIDMSALWPRTSLFYSLHWLRKSSLLVREKLCQQL